RATQPRGTHCPYGQRVGLEADLDVLRADARERKDELQPLRCLLDIHGWFPHRGIRPWAHVAGKFALHAVSPVQQLAGLGPHPAELAINAHVRGLCPTSHLKRSNEVRANGRESSERVPASLYLYVHIARGRAKVRPSNH